MKRYRAIVAAALLLVLVVVTLQNTGSVPTHVLFFTYNVPHAILLFAAAAIGFAAGALVYTKRRQQ